MKNQNHPKNPIKIPDIYTWLFRFNIITVAVTFILLAPASRIVASWYPDNPQLLWKVPLIVLSVCAVLWTLMRLSLPYFIRKGVFADRRLDRQPRAVSLTRRIWYFLLPLITLITQSLFVYLLAWCLIAFMRGEVIFRWITNIP